MPPTNYLWLKVDKNGKTVGLLKWSGRSWVPANDPDLAFDGVEYVDDHGTKHTITGITFNNEDDVVELSDSDGNVIIISNKGEQMWEEYNNS